MDSLLTDARSGQPVTVERELLDACAGVLRRWDWEQRPTWICPMPSRRSSAAIDALCDALGTIGKLPVHRALIRRNDGSADDGYQADQANSAHQVGLVWDRLEIDHDALAAAPDGPVLLVDDEVDSRWTITVAAFRLNEADAGPVLPFALRAR